MIQRARTVYGLLLAVWVLVGLWQGIEHTRVRRSARAALRNRAVDVSNTLGLVLRSQRRFGGIISRERLESALTPLIKPGEVDAIALLNDAGETVAAAGRGEDLPLRELMGNGEYWSDRTVALMNLVDLGTNLTAELEGAGPTIVIPRTNLIDRFNTNLFDRFNTNRPPQGGGPGRRGPDRIETGADTPAPGPAPEGRNPPQTGRLASPPPPDGADTNSAPPRPRGWGRFRPGPDGRGPSPRPFWMSEEEYKTAIQKQGVHSFVMLLSTQSVAAVIRQDLWLRSIILGLAGLCVAVFGWAWRNLARFSELEVRLVRAAELNTRLKEMNLAAAGLAHETRNPLNIIRGIAQMVSREPALAPEVQSKLGEIVTETDHVTAQLNEFINYSRPREVRRAAVPLAAAVNEVRRALSSDLEEKSIRLSVPENLPTIEADEQLLRQALFNLLLNAIQAVEAGTEIQVAVDRTGAAEVRLEVRDFGPGVSPEHRTEVFKPYFTTYPQGTGLGLAVVQQIVLAHGWEIACLPNEPRGAVFRISHVRLAV